MSVIMLLFIPLEEGINNHMGITLRFGSIGRGDKMRRQNHRSQSGAAEMGFHELSMGRGVGIRTSRARQEWEGG